MVKKYTKEFKVNAVDLVLRKKLSCIQVSQDLGIGLPTLKKWVKSIETHGVNEAFPVNGNLSVSDKERRQFKREIEVLRRKRDILKKALAIFSSP
ncbi:MAG: transposase [Rickettsiella sp.]|nr:transposase [Rickettsiella sp.]